MEGSEVDEFAVPKQANENEVPVNLTSKGVIVSSMFEAGAHKTPLERSTLLTMDYGDLNVDEREERPQQESVWTVGKKNVHQRWHNPPDIQLDDMIMIGASDLACYALECPPGKGAAYKEFLSRIECESLAKNFKHSIIHLQIKKQATQMLDNIMVIAKHDETLRPTIKSIGKDLSDQIKVLPEVLPIGTKLKSTVVANRPGNQYPEVEWLFLDYAEEPPFLQDAEGTKGDEFHIWSVHVAEKAKWTRSKTTFVVRENTIPAVAFNKTHAVFLYQPHNVAPEHEDIICVALYKLTDIGRFQKNPSDKFYFKFPESFSTRGVLSMSLSKNGICSIAYSVGCIVIDVLRQIARPRVVILNTKERKHRRMVTSCQVNHLPDEPRPPAEILDDWDAHLSDVLPAERPPVPAWCGTLTIGTSTGEAFGFCWRSGALIFAEVIPALEPVFGCLYSNRRVVMHSVMGLTGKLIPYVTEQITQLPTSRPLAMAICGTLLFALEKYGSLQVFSTTTRSILFPFKPPKSEFGRLAKQHAYQAISAEPMRVVVLYPNMLVRVLEIKKKIVSVPNAKSKNKNKK